MRFGLGIIVVLFTLCSLFAAAQAGIAVSTIDNQITPDEEAIFQVVVTNNHNLPRTYTLYGLDVVWSITPEFRTFTLQSESSRTIDVRVRPLGPFQPSTYSVKLYIDSAVNQQAIPSERSTQELPIILYPQEPVTYLPSLRAEVDMLTDVNPQQDLPISINVVNRNPLNLSSLVVRLESDMIEFRSQQQVNLGPLESKIVPISVHPSKYQEPKEYTLFFVFEYQDQPVKIIEKKINIAPVELPFVVSTSEEKIAYKKFTAVTVRNEGNVRSTQQVKVPVSFVDGLLSTGQGRLSLDKGRFLQWEMSLEPAQVVEVRYVTNYRLPLYLLVILIVIGGFYLWVRSPIKIRKSAETTRGTEEGLLSELKVMLEIQNASNKKLKDVKIIDVIPGIANLEKGLELGTLKPHEITHTKHGTKVSWALLELEPKEHRLITYKLKAKLNILGAFSLPRASVEFVTKKRKRKAYSNIFKLGT